MKTLTDKEAREALQNGFSLTNVDGNILKLAENESDKVVNIFWLEGQMGVEILELDDPRQPFEGLSLVTNHPKGFRF